MSRADRLQAYIVAARGETIVGRDDCGPWVVRWIAQELGKVIDYPAYATREEAYAILQRAGGFPVFAERMLALAGLNQTFDPVLGDVGVIKLSDRHTAAIFCHGGIVVIRGEQRGTLHMRPRNLITAWSLPSCE